MAEKEVPPQLHVVKVVLREKATLGEEVALLAVGMLGGMVALAGALILMKLYY